MTATRRETFGAAALLALAATPAAAQTSSPAWPRGVEGQRKADLGATFLNPIMAGDHPDPSILKDGADYYMTFSSFQAYPGLVIWHSRDLINWRPVTAALKTNIGSVWAPELCKHNGRYFLYVPSKKTTAPLSKTTNWVIWADRIEGPWSEPIDLDLPGNIDPGHAVGEDGSRWLFLSKGDRVRLSDDGLSRIGAPQHVYDAWRYPDDWEVEAFSPEGPKITRHGGWFHMILAVGGTAGPPTGHMVIAARSRSINGPWEHHPGNPLVRTTSGEERWWSRGHATLVEGPAGDWWGVYHGYENGFYTLGRQALLAPVTWTADGWPRFGGGDLARPLPKPKGGQSGPHGQALSDNFSTDRYGAQWTFFNPAMDETARITRKEGVLHLAARGEAPSTSSPLVCTVGDRAYEFECEVDADPGAMGGLLLFYDQKLYCGLGVEAARYTLHQYGNEHARSANPAGAKQFVRIRNDRHIVSMFTSKDRVTWTRFGRGMEVSGYHHNVRGGFLALKPGLYAAGAGEVRFRDFRYRAL